MLAVNLTTPSTSPASLPSGNSAAQIKIALDPPTTVSGPNLPISPNLTEAASTPLSKTDLQNSATLEAQIQPEKQSSSLLSNGASSTPLAQNAVETNNQELLSLNKEQAQIETRRENLEDQKSALEDAIDALNRRETQINREKFRLQQSLGTLINLHV